jgi:hypothetical protein
MVPGARPGASDRLAAGAAAPRTYCVKIAIFESHAAILVWSFGDSGMNRVVLRIIGATNAFASLSNELIHPLLQVPQTALAFVARLPLPNGA